MSLMTKYKTVDITKIIGFINGEIEKSDLSDKDRAVCARWYWIDRAYTSGRIMEKNKLVRAVMQEFDVSNSTAYNDIQMAEHVFGEMCKVQKKYERNMLGEVCRRAIAKAEETGDIRALNGAVKNLMDLQRLNEADMQYPDYKERHPPVIEVSDSEKLLERPLNPAERKELEAFKFIAKPKHDADAEIIE